MMNDTVAGQVGQAWQYHRQGRHEQALSAFENLAQKYSDNIDAHYGLGLAQRSSRRHEAAAQSFRQALTLAEENLAALGEVYSEERDRFMMLKRMIGQRLAEIEQVNEQV